MQDSGPYGQLLHRSKLRRRSFAVKRLYFPDGSEFEGVGIRPDVEVHTSIDDLKKGRDPILEKAE